MCPGAHHPLPPPPPPIPSAIWDFRICCTVAQAGLELLPGIISLGPLSQMCFTMPKFSLFGCLD